MNNIALARELDSKIALNGTSLAQWLVGVERCLPRYAKNLNDVDNLLRKEQYVTKNDGGEVTIEQLYLGAGFHEVDRETVVSALAALGRHLEHWRAESIDVHVSVKDRDDQEQCITLEIGLPRRPPLVVHVSDPNLDRALVEARRLMIRNIEEARSVLASPTKTPERDERGGR